MSILFFCSLLDCWSRDLLHYQLNFFHHTSGFTEKTGRAQTRVKRVLTSLNTGALKGSTTTDCFRDTPDSFDIVLFIVISFVYICLECKLWENKYIYHWQIVVIFLHFFIISSPCIFFSLTTKPWQKILLCLSTLSCTEVELQSPFSSSY